MKATTERGQFRNLALSILKGRDNALWDQEPTHQTYLYPLDASPELLDLGESIARQKPKIPKKQLFQIGPFLATNSPLSHRGPFKHAIDFLVPDGTVVLAAASGVVVEIQETSTTWGPGPKFRDYLNYLTIRHPNGEFSQYCHLQAGSVSKLNISIGTQVQPGQMIATVGQTGWTDREHLHFIVFLLDHRPENKAGFKSLVPQFK